MYKIHLQTQINTSLKNLFTLWKKPNLLLKHASSLNDLKVIKRKGDIIDTRWDLDIKGLNLVWYQQDILNKDKGRIDFAVTKGDFVDYRGFWLVTPLENNRVKLELDASFDWKIPVLEPYVKESLQRKTKTIFKSFFSSIKKTLKNNE